MSGPVQKGDVLTFNTKTKTELTVTWSQSLRTRTEKYYGINASNTTRGGAAVNFYVQKDWFDSQMSSFATVEGDTAKVTINDKFQYGQKNAQGEMRFVIYHDKSRKPYQHRFIETTLQAKAETIAKGLAENLGYGNLTTPIDQYLRSFIGDYLHDF